VTITRARLPEDQLVEQPASSSSRTSAGSTSKPPDSRKLLPWREPGTGRQATPRFFLIQRLRLALERAEPDIPPEAIDQGVVG